MTSKAGTITGDKSRSASGDYSEPSASTVVLPEPPPWLNVDALLSYDEQQRIKDLIEEGRELLVKAAEWGRDAVPLTIHEWHGLGKAYDDVAPILDQVCGIDDLEKLTRMFTIAAGCRYDIDNDYAKRMRDEYPELGLHTVENDDAPSKTPFADSLAMVLEMGYAIISKNGNPARGGTDDAQYAHLNDLSVENARRAVEAYTTEVTDER